MSLLVLWLTTSARALAISPARPLELPAAAAFITAAMHDKLTSGQSMLIERKQLNQVKERFRVIGRYPPPVYDRRLPSCLLVARAAAGGGPIVACGGVELALVDSARRFVLRRSKSEALLRERLPAQEGAPTGALSGVQARNGRAFHRQMLGTELEEEAAALRAQEAALDLPEEERAALRDELSAAVAALPRALRAVPVVSCVTVSPSYRRRGAARELCAALEAEARGWGLGAASVLAMVDEDNAPARALFAALGFVPSFRDEGAVATRAELPSPQFDRRELEVLAVPMPLLG